MAVKLLTKEIIDEYFPSANPDKLIIKKLNILKEKYEANYQLMLKSSNLKYRQIEIVLDRENVRLQKKLRIFISFTKQEMKDFSKRAKLISNKLEEKALVRDESKKK